MIEVEVKVLALAIVKKLQVERMQGITPNNPIKGKDIAQAYNLKFHTDYSDVEVREAVSYARAILGEPIGANDGGYFYCLSEREWEECAKSLRERAAKIQKAAQTPTLKFRTQAQGELLES